MSEEQTDIIFFPGRDYPDREVWLARRATPDYSRGRFVRYIHVDNKKPLVIGTNAAKRALGDDRQELVRERHAFYRTSSPSWKAGEL